MHTNDPLTLKNKINLRSKNMVLEQQQQFPQTISNHVHSSETFVVSAPTLLEAK